MEITPGIHVIRHTFSIPVAPGAILNRFVNSYLVVGETITLIDTGVAGSEAGIFDYIRSIGCVPSDIALILLTHSHPDHIGAARAIRQATGCSIAAHPAEKAWIEEVDLQNHERPVPGFFMLVGGSVKVDRELSDGELIAPEETGISGNMQVIHTPGHSRGSISVFMPEEGVLFSGDAIPVPGTIPVYDDLPATVQSLSRLRSLTGIRILLSAWDEPRKDDEAYQQIDRALSYLQVIHEAVLASMEDGTTDIMELTRKTAAALGLPPHAAGALLARTLDANLKEMDRKNIMGISPHS